MLLLLMVGGVVVGVVGSGVATPTHPTTPTPSSILIIPTAPRMNQTPSTSRIRIECVADVVVGVVVVVVCVGVVYRCGVGVVVGCYCWSCC